MYIDLETRGLPSVFRSDICVVGGGVAGILLASRLGQSGRNVHLLEAGGLEFEERSQRLYRTEIAGEPHSGVEEGRFRTFGGSSTRWAGQLLPFTEDVLHPDSRLGMPIWPIELAELEPYYLEVQKVMGVSTSPFSDELLREFKCELPFQSSRVRLRFSKCAPFVRRNLSMTLGKQCLASSNVTVFTHANALSIDVNGNGEFALGVTATNYGGVRYEFFANQFVICTGTIEASRLLLASTAVCPQGVGNCRGQVGRYFHDHVEVRAAEIAPEDRKRVIRAFAPYVRDGTSYRAKLEATAELRIERSLLSVSAQFAIEEPSGSGADLIRRVLRGIQQGRLNRDLRRDMLGVPAASREIVNLAIAAKLRNRRFVSRAASVVLDIDVEQKPDCESRIRLGEEWDALGMRKAILDWRISGDERASIRCYVQELDGLFREYGLANIHWTPQAQGEGDCWELANRRDTFHMMGGTRMGADPSTSVVDSSLKVHGLRNLYVVSCSVFPSGGSSNPTFTMMALALRLADRLQVDRDTAR
ncbi:GMC oxidoreductase [Edaphobacter modestus]|uniref:Choline dehydrogenase-like flavoprotein n=1 Tax=Edaphobacter modestus TaxID=388466 RepID=A0A4Q7YPJ2_9BACT|nr:GMC family oxidoreductase [Edaphobacter modestus]RZU38984.1 choline dehydrogenase-like flavoprotein [Edaphobacter modestus]